MTQKLVGCGHAMPGHTLLLVDPATSKICGTDEVGEILIQGPSVAGGYWNRADENENDHRHILQFRDRIRFDPLHTDVVIEVVDVCAAALSRQSLANQRSAEAVSVEFRVNLAGGKTKANRER
ncbi:MAG: fatty acyl-AMP ligase [Nostocaceae cyanobacterium CSU_2_110]|nr:fatty acyl-AMP ligase [Nostocaceae cyanobacterium CSU_2_110]